MRAILINPRQDKPGLIGRPVVTQSGVIAALKGTHQAGQRVTLSNMRSIKDKLAKVQAALDGAGRNLIDIENGLNTFDKNLEELKKAESKLGDYWTQFLKHPVTDTSLIRFIDVGQSMDRSREDMMGEYVDPYRIYNNDLLLPRGGLFTPTPGIGTMLNGDQYDYWSYFEPKPWIDPFGIRLPDGGWYATGYQAGTPNYNTNWGPPSTIGDIYTSGVPVYFYGPLVKGYYVTGYSLLEPVMGVAYGACFCPKSIGMPIPGYHGGNYGWHENKHAMYQDNSIKVWVSAPFASAGSGANIERPGSGSIGTFSSRDGKWYWGHCYQATVTVHWKDWAVHPETRAVYNFQNEGQSYKMIDAIEYIDVGFIDDEVGEWTQDGTENKTYDYIAMLQHRRFYTTTGTGSYVTRRGQGQMVAGQVQVIFPCVGFNVTDIGDSAGHVEDPFDRGWQSLFAVVKEPLPREEIDTVPKYFVETSFKKWDGNILGVPPLKIGGRVITQTMMFNTSCRFGDEPFGVGPVEAPLVKATPKGSYNSVQVIGKCSDGSLVLITERIRVKYDENTVNLAASSHEDNLPRYPTAVHTIENVFYGFDPKAKEGDVFDRDCVGKLQQVIVTTFDGKQIVYRDDCMWRDIYDTTVQPNQYEFRQAYHYNQFYRGYP